MHIQIYTDGACSGNPGPGGYGVVMMAGEHRKELSDGYRLTTNNRMELLAVIEGLQALTMHPCQVTVVSDSKYVVDSFLKDWISGWQRRQWKNVKNPDLWKRLIALVELHNVKWHWIKGQTFNYVS